MEKPRLEIGGYFELETFSGEPYHKGAIALNCGRDCLEYLLELRGPSAVWMPAWMCDCQFRVCEKAGIPIKYYEVGGDFRPLYDFEVASGEYLYLMDYYGQLEAADVDAARAASGGHLFVDESHGFFRRPWPGCDTFCTCRKFFGVPDGAYLFTGDGSRLPRKLERAESHGRMGFVLGRYERPAGEFFREACGNNDRFDGEPMLAMSALTENLLRAIDYEGARRRREENFSYLHDQLGEGNLLGGIVASEGPFMYPLLVEDASELRGLLVEEGIFVPTLWPNCIEGAKSPIAKKLSVNILPLPIDQRYGISELDSLLIILISKIERPRLKK